MSVLLSVLGGAAAIIATRSASQAISNIAKRILPFNKSGDAKRMDYQAAISKEQQEMNLRFQEMMLERGFQDKREIARITALWQRQTTFLAAYTIKPWITPEHIPSTSKAIPSLAEFQ